MAYYINVAGPSTSDMKTLSLINLESAKMNFRVKSKIEMNFGRSNSIRLVK